MPKPFTSSGLKRGYFTKQDFRFDAEKNLYVCPADQELTPGKLRRIRRWEHEHVLDAMQDRLDRMPNAMRIRRCTVEHVFGTLKDWMGRSHFKTRTLHNVGTEMSLQVLAYNLKRAITLLGARALMEAMKT